MAAKGITPTPAKPPATPAPDVSHGNPLVTRAGTVLEYWGSTKDLIEHWTRGHAIDATEAARNNLQALIVKLIQGELMKACGILCGYCKDGVELAADGTHGQFRKVKCPAAEIRKTRLPLVRGIHEVDSNERDENVRMLMRMTKQPLTVCAKALDDATGDFEGAFRAIRQTQGVK